jgi:hypothetical protein
MEPDVVLVEEAMDFVTEVRKALDRDAEADRSRRRQLASRNSWEAKTERLLELVSREFNGRGLEP